MYSINVEGLYGAGETIESAKEDLQHAIGVRKRIKKTTSCTKAQN
jgi:predicted RNase H-like HicB family nuclease